MLEIDTIPVISNTAKKTTNAHTPESGTVINKTPRECMNHSKKVRLKSRERKLNVPVMIGGPIRNMKLINLLDRFNRILTKQQIA